MVEIPLLVDDRDRPASDQASFERHNPVTGHLASRAAAATLSDAAAAAAAAARAFPAWSTCGPGERRSGLMRAAALLEARGAAFAEAMTEEIGATASWAHHNVAFGALLLRDAAALTTEVAGRIIPSDQDGMTAFALRQPVGVVLGIAPWNAPVILGVRAIAMPLACGNTVVLKGSEICPRVHRLLGDVMRDAGLGAGVVNVLSNAPADAARIVDALIAHPAIRRVNFTGSTRVGRRVAETAARHLKPAVLELGGKAPLVILDDADLAEAAAAAAFGAFLNQGQICMATERIVVDAAVADAFAARLARTAGRLRAGDPMRTRAPLGSMVGRDAVDRVQGLIQDALAKGATLLCGGQARGTFLDATVLDHVTPSMRLYAEESFGPVAAMIRVSGVDEAVRVANDTEYGLSAAVFGRDVARALGVARRLEAGICHINGATVHDEPQMPFGGVKASGYGRLGGVAAIAEFTELRWITIASKPGRYALEAR